MKNVVILGSSRSNGNTKKAVDGLRRYLEFDLIDLNDYHITYYDYAHRNKNDDFLSLIQNLIQTYDTFIFATPVYWYTMSGMMKVFFDRMTDLLDIEKELGRNLRMKNMAALSSSLGDNLSENFWLPFKETARYLGMNYSGNVHTIVDTDFDESLKLFCNSIISRSNDE